MPGHRSGPTVLTGAQGRRRIVGKQPATIMKMLRARERGHLEQGLARAWRKGPEQQGGPVVKPYIKL